MKKVMIYPISIDLKETFKYFKTDDEKANIKLVVFNEREILSELPNIKNISVFFLDYIEGFTPLEEYQKVLEFLMINHVHIMMGYPLYDKLGLNESSEMIEIVNPLYCQKMNEFKQKKSKFTYFDIPIVAVAGEGSNCDKFKTCLEMKKQTEKKEYKVMTVVANSLGYFMGAKLFPKEMFQNDIALQVKIHIFREWLIKEAKEDKPDMILIEIPGGILPLCEKEPNQYGEANLIISSAFKIDYTVINLYYDEVFLEEHLNDLEKICKYRLSMPLTAIGICRQQYLASIDRPLVEYRYYRDKDLTEVSIPGIYKNIKTYDESSIDKFMDYLIDQMSSNLCVV